MALRRQRTCQNALIIATTWRIFGKIGMLHSINGLWGANLDSFTFGSKLVVPIEIYDLWITMILGTCIFLLEVRIENYSIYGLFSHLLLSGMIWNGNVGFHLFFILLNHFSVCCSSYPPHLLWSQETPFVGMVDMFILYSRNGGEISGKKITGGLLKDFAILLLFYWM